MKHPHPDAQFSTIGDDTITALATLANIFKNKFQKPLAPQLAPQSPIKAAENKRPSALVQSVLKSLAKHVYQTWLNTQLHPPLPMLVTSKARSAAPPRVPAMERNLSPGNLSEDF
jgi:hypothetical protein